VPVVKQNTTTTTKNNLSMASHILHETTLNERKSFFVCLLVFVFVFNIAQNFRIPASFSFDGNNNAFSSNFQAVIFHSNNRLWIEKPSFSIEIDFE